MRLRSVLAAMAYAALASSPGLAQTPDQVLELLEPMRFREIGPTIMSGRVSDLAVVESDPRVFYVGTATGGVWKTTNAGISFAPIFDDYETSSIGDVTVSPSNPNVVWVGTGEPQNRQSSPWGNGVYRSVDGGHTFAHLGLEDTHHISRIQVHPRDPDIAYVAAVGHLWGANPERGVYKTVDGGATWEKVLYIDDSTGAIDLVMDPNDPATLFVAMYQRQRRAWGFNGGGPGSGIYRTYDAGRSWTEVTNGLPASDKGRIGLSVYRQDGNVICALVEADARRPGAGFGGGDGPSSNGVYCSTDRGEKWQKRSDTNNRPMYYSQIRIDPNDPERIYLGGSNMFRSSDGGRNFTADAAAGVHLDHHAIWIDPADSDHMLLGGDGGVSVSWDRSDNWYQFRNLPVSQFYEIGLDMREPYHVCGGLQDNGSWCAPSDTWSNQGIRTRDWYNVGSGDGFFTAMNPTDPTVMFAESQGGNLTRVDLQTMERTRIRAIGRPEGDGDLPDLRWNWDSPVLVSAHDANTVYAGSNVLFRSRDLGQSWEALGGDLTHAIDRETLEIMGVLGATPQISINDGQSSYGNLTAIAESPLDANVLYTGSDDGRLNASRDGGASWTDITAKLPGLPANTYLTRILASNAAAGTVWVLADGHRSDDFAPYVFVSTDFGSNFRPLVNGLPHTSVNAIAQHHSNPNLLFVGNEVGVYASVDAGASWVRMPNLPTVPVDDIKIHPRDNDLVLGTHGRGIWIMDDIGALEEMSPEVFASSAYLFRPRAAVAYSPYTPQGWTPGIWEASNPPAGVRVRYWLDGETDDLSLTVTDAMGTTIRVLEASNRSGMNEVMWDMRLVLDGSDGEPMSPGPRVLPGTYLVRLNAADVVIESEAAVRLDPRVEISRADLMARQNAMLDAYWLSGPVSQATAALRRLQGQLQDGESLLEAAADAPAELAVEVEALIEAIDSLQDELSDASTGANMVSQIQGVTGPPTADQLFAIERSWQQVPPVVERANELLRTRVPALYRSLYLTGIAPDVGSPIVMPARVRR